MVSLIIDFITIIIGCVIIGCATNNPVLALGLFILSLGICSAIKTSLE